MALCGLAGLLLYLLLPTLGSLSSTHDLTFWQLLKGNLQFQKYLLFVIPKQTLLLLSLTSFAAVVPAFDPLGFAFRRPQPHRADPDHHHVPSGSCGDPARVSVGFAGPEFSPRKVGFGLAFLPLYFLGALCVGYYSGYLLLVFRAVGHPLASGGAAGGGASNTPPPVSSSPCFVIVPAVLVYRNLAQIRLTNGPTIKQFAADLAADLPQKRGVILSDDPRRLWLLQDHLARTGRSGDFILLCSQWLPAPQVPRIFEAAISRMGHRPPSQSKPKQVEDLELVGLMQQLAKDHELCLSAWQFRLLLGGFCR